MIFEKALFASGEIVETLSSKDQEKTNADS
jgi:hypothetical protein